MIVLNFTDFITFTTSRSISFDWVENTEAYHLACDSGLFTVSCTLDKSPSDTTDLVNFETNYKPTKKFSKLILPSAFSAKVTTDGKKLYARTVGVQQEVTVGANTIDYVLTYPWCKMIGAEIINCSALDYIDFKVYDSEAGTYSGVSNYLLNQFGFSVNLPKDFYRREAPYDADIYQGMKLSVTYNTLVAKTIGINLLLNEVKS